MTTFKDLSLSNKQSLVNDINNIMIEGYNIDKESVNDFWETFNIGIDIIKGV